ncbi:zinc finger protein RFP-like [Mixophyes fleayi]|uniref:zinc finger protein RFP-like n=1 Tax=Mixophyes fleayi TaxID=3061075 RepID=UPI003F4E26AB
MVGQCSLHRKLLEYYCFEDTARICISCCLAIQHRGHQVMTLSEASEKKKEILRNILQQLVSGDKTEMGVQSLKEHMRKVKDKSATLMESITSLFQDIEDQLTELKERVLSEISKQEKQVSSSVFNSTKQLEVKKDDIYSKILYIEELCNTMDHRTVLQADVSDLSYIDEGNNIDIDDTNVETVGDLDEDLITHTLQTGLASIVTDITSGIYVQEALNMALDVNTAGSNLKVSSDLKTASWSAISQNYPDKPERFQYNQVLSKRVFSSGQHEFEVETSETGNWMIGMAYSSIDRKGHQSLIGDNNKSWCLRRYDNWHSVTHDRNVSELPEQPSQHRFRIHLDYGAGQLSFYELGDPIRRLHTFTTTFSEPLHAVLWLWSASVTIRS